MHWPIASVDGVTVQPDEFPTIIDTWRAMEALIPTGKCKAIGVSNFSIPLLEKLLDPSNGCTVVPAVNQIECHPSRPQFELVEWCQKKGIHVTAYSSLGQPGGRPEKGGVFDMLHQQPVSCGRFNADACGHPSFGDPRRLLRRQPVEAAGGQVQRHGRSDPLELGRRKGY